MLFIHVCRFWYMFANFLFVLKVATLLKDFTIHEYLQHSPVTLELPCVWWSAILRISHVEHVMLLNCSGREWKLQPAALAPSTSDQLGWTTKCLRKLTRHWLDRSALVSMVSSRCVGCGFPIRFHLTEILCVNTRRVHSWTVYAL